MKTPHPKNEQTLIIIKPDGIQRSLIGEIIQRYERVGLKLVAMKMMVPTSELIEKHYTLDPEWRRVTGEKTIKAYHDKGLVSPSDDPLEITNILLGRLCKYMTSGPIIVMIWEGAHAVGIVSRGQPACAGELGLFLPGSRALSRADADDLLGPNRPALRQRQGTPRLRRRKGNCRVGKTRARDRSTAAAARAGNLRWLEKVRRQSRDGREIRHML